MDSPARPDYSLSRRLIAALLGVIALVWLATTLYSYFEARHEINEMLDAHLAQSASLVVVQTTNELAEIDTEHAPQLHRRARRLVFQIWERGERLRLHSSHAPQSRLSAQDEGFSDSTVEGVSWRVFGAWNADRRFLVQVGEREDRRREITAGIAVNLLAPLLLALPALGLLVWLAIARGMMPLRALGRQVAERRPDNLAPLGADSVPAEVAPLVRGLNDLFSRVERLIEGERRFTADAAHELRTPLSALRTQAQVARAAAGESERQRALDNVIAGCDRATRLVEQLLTLARLEPGLAQGAAERCDLRLLAREAVAEAAPAALGRKVEIELADGAPAAVDGHPGLIAILLRNLLDNAVRYSAAGGSVRVEVVPEEARSVISVTDDGPGIPTAERQKVGQRFYRVLGSGEAGSGLGLSIVHRIADIHGAEVSLGDGPGGRGLRVTVAFPARARHA